MKKVLIVEDDTDAAEVLAMGLSRHGFETASCGTAAGALATVDHFEPDVALVDIGLPDVDGFGLTEALRGRPALAHLWIIAVTGRQGITDRARAHAAGMDMFLTKPVDVDEVAGLLQGLARLA